MFTTSEPRFSSPDFFEPSGETWNSCVHKILSKTSSHGYPKVRISASLCGNRESLFWALIFAIVGFGGLGTRICGVPAPEPPPFPAHTALPTPAQVTTKALGRMSVQLFGSCLGHAQSESRVDRCRSTTHHRRKKMQ